MKKTCCNFDCRQGRDCPLPPESNADRLHLFFVIALRLALCAVPFIIWKIES